MKKIFGVFVSMMIMAPLAQAQILVPQDRGFVGLLLGSTTTTDLDSRTGFGVEGGLTFTNGWTGSLFYLSSDGSSDDVDAQVLHYGVGADYSLAHWLNGLKLGVRLGNSSVDFSGTGAPDNQSGFTYGPAISYDYMVNEMFSIGAQAQYYWNQWDSTENTSYFFLSGKFWL